MCMARNETTQLITVCITSPSSSVKTLHLRCNLRIDILANVSWFQGWQASSWLQFPSACHASTPYLRTVLIAIGISL